MTRSSPALALLLAAAATAAGQTITVNTAEGDAIDINPATATVADLPGPDGRISFTEALIASNHTPGRQTIAFAIPPAEWTYLPWYYPGQAVITGMMMEAIATDPVTIDGTTQTAFSGDTNPDRHEVVILRGGGLYLPADDCRITGLDRTSVYVEGSRAVIEHNSGLGIEISGVAGGSGSVVRGNTVGGHVQINQSSDNLVVGSTFDRVRVLGWIAGGRPAARNRIGGPAPEDRNHLVGLGTISSQGIPSGFAVQLFDAVGTIIENNWIGLSPDGLSPGHASTTMGIFFDSENHDTVIRDNRIAGVLAVARPPHAPAYFVGTGIQIYGSGSGVSITGNTIGLNAAGQPLGSVTGITTTVYALGTVEGVTIGGPGPGEGNEITAHLQAGVSIANSFRGATHSGNSIHDNGALGIDLIGPDFMPGLTPNDPLDADTGGNGLQNFPVLAAANAGPGQLRITGTLDSSPSGDFTLEFFASAACDPSGHGEGEQFLGSANVTTNGAGHAGFDVTLSATVPAGSFITATATRAATGDTSEFSACIPAAAADCPPDLNGDGLVDFADYLEFLNRYDALDLTVDFTGDGLVDFADYLEFLNLYDAGC